MKPIKIDYPVITLDNRMLLDADTKLTSETFDELLEAQKATCYPTIPILKYSNVCQDLQKFFCWSSYPDIFDDQYKRLVLSLMNEIHFILPVLESLDYFKKNNYYTYRHILIVFALSTIMSQELLDSDYWIKETKAGHLHDFGKLCIPLKIMKKFEPLTKKERAILEHHALAGYVLLIYYLKDTQNFAAKVAKEHHERGDGSGYPLGITLKDRMVEIIAACDVYDALLSPRPYRLTPYKNRAALEEITDMAKRGAINWDVVQCLVAYNRKDKQNYQGVKVSGEKRCNSPPNNLYGVILDNDEHLTGGKRGK